MNYRLLQTLCLATALLLSPEIGAQQARSQEKPADAKGVDGQTAAPADVNAAEDQTEGDNSREPSEEAKKEAAQRFQRGLSFYEEAEYGLALIEFERAYQLVPDYRVLYNIGQVSIQLSRFSQALRALREYLKQGGAALGKERVEAVERDLQMLGARTAQLSLSGTEGAEIMIDDENFGTLPLDSPLLVDAGRHRLEVRKEGFREFSERLTLAGAEVRQLTVELEPKATVRPEVALTPTPSPEITPPPTMVDEPSASKTSSPWLIAGWSTTGVLAGGAVLSGILGLNASKKLSDLKSSPDPSRSDLDSRAQSAKTWLAAADILTVAAVATGGISLYFTLKGKPRSERARLTERASTDLSVLLSPRALHVSGRF